MTDQESILLNTKLYQPHLPNDLVKRERLFELLRQDINRPLTLVCAPAGFGKTTLVSTWLEEMTRKRGKKATALASAWLSLDENDNDLNLFLRYTIGAIRTVFKEACADTLALLQSQHQPPQTFLYSTFSNELAELPGKTILVLDDYQFIHEAAVHKLITELMRHWPEPLHLVLISRSDPPIPLTDMRAKGMLNEIRTRNLRFTSEETASYLSRGKFAQPDPSVLQIVGERIEGWPAGLHLAALSIRSTDNQADVLASLSSGITNISEYLIDEVLNRQFSPIQTFLLKSSILDRFCVSLCEALMGGTETAWNARACLDWIEHAELFLIALDDQRVWYRYHQLFQESLRKRLSSEAAPDEVRNLHRQASAWFEEQRLLEEAIEHALAAGDADLAARQMSAGLSEVLNRGDRATLERWMRLLPEDAIQRNPELLMIRIYALQFSWQFDRQAKVIRQVEELLDAETGRSLPINVLKILRGQILTQKGQQAFYSNQTERAIDLCREALALLPAAWKFVRGGTIVYLGLSMQANGRTAEAERLLLDEYESCADKTDTYALYLLLALGLIYLNTGRLEQASQIAPLILQGATLSGLPILQSWAHHIQGMVNYHRNEPEAATQQFNKTFENPYISQTTVLRDAVTGLALIHQTKGESCEAWQALKTISQFDLEQNGSEDERTRSLRARLMLMQGNLEGARQWIDTSDDPPPDRALFWLEEPQLTRARVLMGGGNGSDPRPALKILDALDEIAERTHDTRHRIEILALRSLGLDALGETEKAQADLNLAIDLARPGGFTRVFTDLGSPMQALLSRLAGQDHSMEMIKRILGSFPEDDHEPSSEASRPARGVPVLAEPLTARELEVLSLLREPLSAKQIAAGLNISYETVRRHIATIYDKLEVNRRWEAVARAEELKILPPR